MSLLAPPSSYDQIADRLDEIGQKYRAQRIMRGVVLWIAGAVVVWFAAALAAHVLGKGRLTYAVLLAWGAWMLYSTWHWFIRPLLIRPRDVEVARFIESRIDGLHNGLTNGLLLAQRDDLASSPWLTEIYNEIASNTSTKPLGSAVRLKDLVPLVLRASLVIAPLVLIAFLFPRPFFHGWSQLLAPDVRVPTQGGAQIIDVQPKDVTIILGQPLEITIVARCGKSPHARLIFEKVDGPDAAAEVPPIADLSPAATLATAASVAGDAATCDLQYNFHLDGVKGSLKYYVEVAGSQSQTYAVTAVHDLKLQDVSLVITPPTYTGLPRQHLAFNGAELARATLGAIVQGSRVELGASVDIPIGGALLDTGAATPAPMDSVAGGRRFMTALTVMDDMTLAMRFVQSTTQVVAKLPDPPLVLHCVRDQPPTIDMRWPTQDLSVPPDAQLKLHALLHDDYGVAMARVLMAADLAPASDARPADAPASDARPADPDSKNVSQLVLVHQDSFPPGTGVKEPMDYTFTLDVKPEWRKHGNAIRVQLEAVDNRDLRGAIVPGTSDAIASADSKAPTDDGGPQTASSPVFTVRFEDSAIIAQGQKEQAEKLRQRLTEMLAKQRGLHDQTVAAQPDARDLFLKISSGQEDLLALMKGTAQIFVFAPDEMIVQKVLLKLTYEEARDAVDQSSALATEPAPAERLKLHPKLAMNQAHIIDILQTLLANLSMTGPTTHPSTQEANDPLLSNADALKKLDDALKQYMKQEHKVLDQTTSLAKKPVDNWDQDDQKTLEDLKMAQEKLDAFMQEKTHDFSKNSEQDMANSSMLKQLIEVTSETTMARDALKQKAAEIAVAAEENGVDNAKTLTSNIEKWLSNAPDRTKWTQEDPLTKQDLHMPELPKELEDLVGQLLEQQEDLFDDTQDANANWAGSFDKGVGWDAADGPIASMNAQGVTGNQLPNNNEMNGRSGEGRSGKSQGEFVEDHASGKGGRNTPTRLDPTPFQKGQVKDDSKDPTGGATGGGKMSGEGGAGLEGPVPPQQKAQMQRLAQKQAQLRNAAERLNLQYKVDRYDNFKLEEAILLMRRNESDLRANRYVNVLRRREMTLNALDSSRLLVGGEIHVQQDTTPSSSHKLAKEMKDAMQGELIPAYAEPLKEYYRKLGQQ